MSVRNKAVSAARKFKPSCRHIKDQINAAPLNEEDWLYKSPSEVTICSMCRSALPGAVLRRLPDRQAESNLVHEVCEVVDQVQDIVIDGSHEVAEEVAQGVDGPAEGDDVAHR